MFVVKLFDGGSGHLFRTSDLVEAFNTALCASCKWQLFFKTADKPAKLLAYCE